ncbi:MAG: hypothetical protein KatS3mg038_3502 [Candidatus Kapaibacterium sp.]|nr:MAG: hypothetical protein KatS3mg038_3375 [Candidatus Kapabacteria bacterium]GIV52981.1 MAG: hypothetical protein KatS3mg038_3502 [Candidatus Kapabacteria bacterium]
MASVIGGGKYIVFYTMTPGQTPSIGATPVFSLSAQIKSTVNVNFAQSHEVDIEHVEDSHALYAFLEQYVDAAAGSETEELTYEDGTKTSASASAKTLLAIIRGGLTSTGARKIYSAAVVIDPTSGAWSQEGNKYNRPAFKLKSVDPGGTVTVPTTYYAGIAVTPAQVTFGLDTTKYGRVTFA